MSILPLPVRVLALACLTSTTLFAQDSFPPKGATLVEKRKQKDEDSNATYPVHKYSVPVIIDAKTQWPVAGTFKRYGNRMWPEPPPKDMAWGNFYLKGVVVSFEGGDAAWSATLALVATKETDISWSGDDVEYELVRVPDKKEATLHGTRNGNEMKGLLRPGVVYDVAIDGGRIIGLRIGEWSEPVLTNPYFKRGDRLSFRFTTAGIDKLPRTVSTTPTLIEGADYNNYKEIAPLGGKEWDKDMLEWWSIYVMGSTESIVVAAPLIEGRGDGGALTLETNPAANAILDELRARTATKNEVISDGGSWLSMADNIIGEIPKVQRSTLKTSTHGVE